METVSLSFFSGQTLLPPGSDIGTAPLSAGQARVPGGAESGRVQPTSPGPVQSPPPPLASHSKPRPLLY